MKRLLALPPLLLAVAALAAPTIDPPPGWRDVLSEGKVRNAVVALKGPETSSFIVKRAPTAPLDNPAGVRGYLRDVLAGLRAASRREYQSTGRVETRSFRNGLTAQLLRAQLKGEERLVLALFGAAGKPYVAVLMSAAPEAMLTSLLGALELDRIEGVIQSKGVVRSLDGQLELALGGGLRSRSLGDAEKAKGFVLAIQGAGAEILFMKLAESDATKPGEQAAITRALAAAAAGVDVEKAAAVRSAPTAAGPVGVYSWAPGAGGEKMSAGDLPWGYWGYQLFGRGPGSDELLAGALAALKGGPTAVAGLLAASPTIPIEKALPWRKILLGAAAVLCALGAAGLLSWSLRRKNANLPS
ncbi:MAG: hypothetical protein COV48_00385 [Elusimicrobia bacterium CG11_big_fil_rev_8_21_14_0_20_64_6]|nr:MAG: hypothetical protein COV48_00385 [Elusimicrobia bacterium CG11_big_fil_rev_8_21_14_0_20_64_6]